ncbi:MAG: TonB-dependent receptor plug domain-containing protein [Bacteroidota bacterium]
MKNPTIFTLLFVLLGPAFNNLSAQQSNPNGPAANNPANTATNKSATNKSEPVQPTSAPYDTATDIEAIEAAMVNAVNLGKPRNNLSSVVISIQQKNPLTVENLGRDIPFLTQSLANVISTSDAGNGIGYSGIRVRGSDATRTNITINGVPINDAESQGTFWVNMPDLSSSIGSLSLTKGAGLSTHGAGAFGATLAIGTETNSNEPYYQIDQSLGSFGTIRTTLKGALKPIKLSNQETLFISARLSEILSDGFVDRASSNLLGYQTAIAYEKKTPKPRKMPADKDNVLPGDKGAKITDYHYTRVKFLAFGGKETTYQAWWGVPIEKYNLGQTYDSTNFAALQNHYLRNSGFQGATYRNGIDSSNLFNANPNRYNYYTYDNEVDNYQQHHQHLYLTHDYFGKRHHRKQWAATLYHTFGTGYFEQFRYGDAFSKYNIPPIRMAGDTNITVLLSASDLVRRRWLRNNLIGVNLHHSIEQNKNNWLFGLGANQYYGNHFGQVTKILALSTPEQNPPREYYRGIGNKSDVNAFVKFNRRVAFGQNDKTRGSVYADIQLRKVNHVGSGTDNDLRTIDFKGNFLFFNPKAGFQLQHATYHHITGYVGVANREPARSDFTDNLSGDVPRPERMINGELSYLSTFPALPTFNGTSRQNHIRINAYYMHYKDQLVLTGAVNDVGTPLRKNVDVSFRRGLEFEGQYVLWEKDYPVANHSHYERHYLHLIGNLSLSQNIIPNSKVTWQDYGSGIPVDTVYKNAPIAYSPNTVAALGLQGQIKRWNVSWLSKWVGRQFLDNTGDVSRSLNPYKFSELTVNYTHKFRGGTSLALKAQCNNLFSARYASNGYTYGYMYGSRDITQEVFVFPQAPRNFLFGLTWRFTKG